MVGNFWAQLLNKLERSSVYYSPEWSVNFPMLNKAEVRKLSLARAIESSTNEVAWFLYKSDLLLCKFLSRIEIRQKFLKKCQKFNLCSFLQLKKDTSGNVFPKQKHCWVASASSPARSSSGDGRLKLSSSLLGPPLHQLEARKLRRKLATHQCFCLGKTLPDVSFFYCKNEQRLNFWHF